VIQLSINALKPLAYHIELGAKLAPLRDRGVMIIASGNVVHNLKRVQWEQPDGAFDWAQRFDEAAVERMSSAPADILALSEHPDFDLAVPTPDHFIPLLYAAGLASAGEGSAQALVQGYALGSISMTCYGVGVTQEPVSTGGPAAASKPEAPAEQSNI
jgi:4,5-DOPA dioxygenase extradiol